MSRQTNIEEVRRDLYYAEFERTHDPEMAAARAHRLSELVQNGLYYQRQEWRRTLASALAGVWRSWQRHWRKWWGAYVAPVAILGFVILMQNLYNPAHHYGGIEKIHVVSRAQFAARNWYLGHGPISQSGLTFMRSLVVERVMRTNKGPIHLWYVRFADPARHRHLCVLENDHVTSVAVCGRKK